MNFLPALLALVSLGLTLWQWLGARRFPLHRCAEDKSFTPAATLLKPLKGCDAQTAACLRSWLAQDYPGPVQILFGVADASDPVCAVVNTLLTEFPRLDARLILCPEVHGANLKVSKLLQLERRAAHEIIIISDADVRVAPDFIANAIGPLRHETTGLVNCFYRLANPATTAMHWEAVAVNADFWSSVLQARSLAPLDFALGAAMLTRRQTLADAGGFAAIADSLADDYQLGHRIAARGKLIELSTVVVDCWDKPMNWRQVWRHQLRWARTIRVSKPAAYFFSILSNATLWPLLWLALQPTGITAAIFGGCLAVRILTALDLQKKLTGGRTGHQYFWLVPVKDLLQVALWIAAYFGRTIEWRGARYRLRRDGQMEKAS